LSQYLHIQETEKKLNYNINTNIFKEYEDKIEFYPIGNLATGDDCLNILINNILCERKNSWVNAWVLYNK
jgi:hypothetical protein